ncbi:MAG: response regulator [Prevotella sp.]|nr:response regulator [Prevotella sp.]MBQ8629732.1 response regulator [Prevotella sp.]MEE1091581.1 response regulator [Prevotella sp.]
MEQLILNIEDKSILPSLKKILSLIDGVSIVHPKQNKKSQLDLAREDVKKGRVISYSSKEDLFKDLGL